MELPAPARRRWPLLTGLVVISMAGVAARMWPRSPLWLDEAQSVAFARLPLARIPSALREDGAPPLYYLVLHGWMELFGSGDEAVRSLSVVLSVAGAATLAVVAARLAGPDAAVATVALVALGPFVVRYGSEARMYSLVLLEVAVALLVVERTWARPRWWTTVLLAATVAALLYTHYWSLYLLAALLALVPLLAVGRGGRPLAPYVHLLAALLAGIALWLPWFPTFRFQAGNTGTPWWSGHRIINPFLSAAGRGTGAGGPAVTVLALVLAALAGWAVITTRRRGTTPGPPVMAVLLAVSTGLATIGSRISASATPDRYVAVLVPLVVLLAAIGLAALPKRALRAAVAAVVLVLGGIAVVSEVASPRTMAADVHRALVAGARPGDVVVYCPDQLGPAVSRLVERGGPRRLRQHVFPDGGSPDRVDWIGYAWRYQHAPVRSSAVRYVQEASSGTVWVLWSGSHPPTQRACTRLVAQLSRLRPHHRQVLADRPDVADHGALWRFDAVPTTAR